MFKYVLLFAFVAYVSAVGSSDDATAEVKSQHADVRPDGFDADLDTSNSIHVVSAGDAQGNIKGEFGWVSPEGTNVQLTYVADENGYQPKSDLLPTPPPTPEAIIKELEWLSSHPQKDAKN
ncbi:PREDICTED: larval cuticle protein 1-like [Rhagoletis zephyria]|uniref:larval cuticle protein 1-like n=1 Tax=Rhagoletis zephyria TaxID=28612 RepID=UPI0008112744|nr:PREDICTED: larval cuticle protein 1-like [Rhagoletis zephyria]